MKDYTNLSSQTQSAVGFDAGLRSFMLKIYNYMALALALSGTIAYFAGTSEAFLMTVAGNPILTFIVMLAPLGLVFFLGFRINKMSLQTAQLTFWIYSALIGLSLFWIFAAYTQTSVARAFFVTAATFGAVSLYGYTTKRDLTSMGHFMIMGLIGIIIASLVNIFLHSSALQFAVSIISVIVFVGLIAYDNQKLKAMYYQTAGNAEMAGKYAILGALNLYMDFINLFISILRLVGDRK
jgi:hypothetical protein